jgi:pimeloyl-ACP methyl ester carboxylesterase
MSSGKFSGVLAFAALFFANLLLHAEEKARIEILLINTRCAPVCGDLEQGKEKIRYYRLEENQTWSKATPDAFAKGGDQDTPTVFLIHGNRTTSDEAVDFAWPVYCWLSRHAENRAYRFVIWSWPSSQMNKRTRPDVQTKAWYCNSQSYYFADCLKNMNAETPVSLVGYSFGAKIIAGGLHLLDGGELAGRTLPNPMSSASNHKRNGPLRTVFIAPAFDCFALNPGQEYSNALSQTEDALSTRNYCDNALRWYPRLYGRGGPQAFGFVGPSCGGFENLHIFEATYCVGKSHDWNGYISCPNVLNALPHYLFAER